MRRVTGWADAPVTSFTYNYDSNFARATIFKDGEELSVGFSQLAKGGLRFDYEPMTHTNSNRNISGDVLRDLADWDLAAILDLNTTPCIGQEKTLQADTLPGGHTWVFVKCGDDPVGAYLDGKALVEQPRPWTVESLTQLLDEVRLLSGTWSVFYIELSFESSQNYSSQNWRGNLQFKMTPDAAATGAPCASLVKRDLRMDTSYSVSTMCLPGGEDVGEPIDVASLDPAAIERAIRVGADALGWSDSTKLSVKISRTEETEPWVRFSHDDGTALVTLDGELLEVEEYER